MSFWSKLFHKEEKKEVDPNYLELPYGKFLFDDDDELEIGYVADIDWYGNGSEPVSIFIEVDVPGSRDASLGIERFTRLYDDRKQVDYKVKLTAAEHYLGDDSSIVDDCGDTISKEEFLEGFTITAVYVYRSGKRVYSLEFPWVRDGMDHLCVIFDEDDKAIVLEDSEYYKEFKSLIYPDLADE